MEKNKRQKIKCYHSDCGYEWNYKGKSGFYATCPRCLRKISISKANKIKQEA